MTFGVLCLELIVLYFLSSSVTKRLFLLFMRIFRSRPVAISLLLALQFPGTVIHELSHLFTAEVLGVKTGKLTLEPESIREASIQAGSVMIAESDPFRRYAIGLAPLVWGMVVLTAISYFLQTLHTVEPWMYALLGYLLFAVSNTMFPSPEDVKGIWPFLIVVSIFLLLGYLVGFRMQLSGIVLATTVEMLETLVKSLGMVVGINVLLALCSSLLFRLFRQKIH